jgi:NADH-quinone oxidoreductase subunit N
VQTLLFTSVLGLACLALEILNLRKVLVPFVILALIGILGVNYIEWFHPGEVMLSGIDMRRMMGMDHYSVAFNGVAIVLTALIIGLTADYYKDEKHHLTDYLAIIIFILCGAMVLFSYANLVMLFLGIEIVSISLYILAGSRKHDIRSNEAGFKYFLMGSFASAILLFGIALLYGATGSFELEKITKFSVQFGLENTTFKIGALMTIVALLFKVAAVPFHWWSPDVYEGSPTLVTAFMSTIVKVSFFAAFYKIMATALSGIHNYTDEILMISAGATMVLGNVVALTQFNFKRLLAYSGISHAGYMLLAILSLRTDSSSALLFYGAVYALASIGAFAIAIPVFSARNNENVDAFNGLGKSNPWMAGLLTMSMLSLAGIPPLAGFLGKYYIFSEAIQNKYIALTVLAVLTSIVGVYYYFKVILAMYVKQGDESVSIKFPLSYIVVAFVCIGLSLLLGIWPGILINLL